MKKLSVYSIIFLFGSTAYLMEAILSIQNSKTNTIFTKIAVVPFILCLTCMIHNAG